MTLKHPLIFSSYRLRQLYAHKDKMHNFTHILRIRRIVTFLRKEYKHVDEDLLRFLINFHGLKTYVCKHKHYFSQLYVQALLRHTKRPQTLEEQLVHDANLLDNLGKHGITKALFVGKLLGRSREATFAYLRTCLKKKLQFYTRRGKLLGRKEIKSMQRVLSGLR